MFSRPFNSHLAVKSLKPFSMKGRNLRGCMPRPKSTKVLVRPGFPSAQRGENVYTTRKYDIICIPTILSLHIEYMQVLRSLYRLARPLASPWPPTTPVTKQSKQSTTEQTKGSSIHKKSPPNNSLHRPCPHSSDQPTLIFQKSKEPRPAGQAKVQNHRGGENGDRNAEDQAQHICRGGSFAARKRMNAQPDGQRLSN